MAGGQTDRRVRGDTWASEITRQRRPGVPGQPIHAGQERHLQPGAERQPRAGERQGWAFMFVLGQRVQGSTQVNINPVAIH